MLFQNIPQIKTIGKSIFDPIWASEFHTNNLTELLHIVKGRMEFTTDEYSITCREGDTIYVPTGTRHKDEFALGSYFETYIVQLEWEDEPELLKEFNPAHLCPKDLDIRREIRRGFERIFRDHQQEIPGLESYMGVQLLWIICAMCRENAVSESPVQDEAGHSRRIMIMEEARRIILENYNKPVSLESIASQMNLSTFYLSRVFSKESGFTLSDFITNIRMEKASEMLADPRINISEIALAVGYKDSRYFSQAFKSHFGVSPKAYRDSIPVGSERI